MSLRPWLFLLAAVASEVTGVTVMKLAADSGALADLLFMYAMVGLSFWFLATAMQRLPMALAYAAWETVGLVCIAAIGLRWFGESLGPAKLAGLGLLLVGVLLVNLGAPRQED